MDSVLFFHTQVPANKMQIFIHSTTPYIHPRLELELSQRFPIEIYQTVQNANLIGLPTIWLHDTISTILC